MRHILRITLIHSWYGLKEMTGKMGKLVTERQRKSERFEWVKEKYVMLLWYGLDFEIMCLTYMLKINSILNQSSIYSRTRKRVVEESFKYNSYVYLSLALLYDMLQSNMSNGAVNAKIAASHKTVSNLKFPYFSPLTIFLFIFCAAPYSLVQHRQLQFMCHQVVWIWRQHKINNNIDLSAF